MLQFLWWRLSFFSFFSFLSFWKVRGHNYSLNHQAQKTNQKNGNFGRSDDQTERKTSAKPRILLHQGDSLGFRWSCSPGCQLVSQSKRQPASSGETKGVFPLLQGILFLTDWLIGSSPWGYAGCGTPVEEICEFDGLICGESFDARIKY